MIKKAKILLTAIIVFILTDANAQAGYEDVVYLKNGSVIHGVIIEQVPNQTIKIQIKDKSVFIYRMDEIEKITKEKKYNRKERDEEETTALAPLDIKNNPYTGYSFTIETGIGPGGATENENGITIAGHFINGITVNSNYSFGVGIGFDYFTTGYEQYNTTYYDDYSRIYLNLTYYLDVRIFPVKGKVSPLLVLDGGYSNAMFSSKVTGGAFGNFGVGAKFNFTQKFGLNLSLSYKIQNFRYMDEVYDYYNNSGYVYKQVNEKFTLKYFCINIGITL